MAAFRNFVMTKTVGDKVPRKPHEKKKKMNTEVADSTCNNLPLPAAAAVATRSLYCTRAIENQAG